MSKYKVAGLKLQGLVSRMSAGQTDGYSLSDVQSIAEIMSLLPQHGVLGTSIKNSAMFFKDAGFEVEERNGLFVIKE